MTGTARDSRRWALVLVVLLTLVFAATVAFRAPFLGGDVENGEGVPRVLRHIAVWDEVGLADTHFMMRTTGTAPADRYIPDVGYLGDARGIYYYVSFPPLFPLVPYAVFKLFGVPASPLAVRLFNVLLHALGTLAAFVFAREAGRGRGERYALFTGFGAGLLYATSSILLWYQSNAYSTASLSTPFFILAAYFALRAVHDESSRWWHLVALGVCTWFVAGTEWLGVTMAAVALVYGVVRRRDPRARRMAAVVVGVVAVTMLAMVAQYSTVAGLSAYLSALAGKYEMRSGLAETSHHSVLSLASWMAVGKNYFRAYQQFVVLIPLLAAPGLYAWWVRRRTRDAAPADTNPATSRRRVPAASPLMTAFALTAGPIALHHLLLFSHTVIHVFDVLKSASVLGLLFGLAIASLDREAGSWKHARLFPAVLALTVALSAGGGMVLSYRRYFAIQKDSASIGRAIREADVPPDQIVFLSGGPLYAGSVVVFNAGRNMTWYSPEGARDLARLSGADGGVLFVISADGKRVESIQRVNRDGQVVPRP